MAKDSFWFRHNAGDSRSIGLVKLRLLHTWAGPGLFWATMELLREQDSYFFLESDIQIMAKVIDCEEPKYATFIRDCVKIGVLKLENGRIFSQDLIDDMKIWDLRKSNGSKGGKAKSSKFKQVVVADTTSKPLVSSTSKPLADTTAKQTNKQTNIIEEEKEHLKGFFRIGIKEYKQLPSQYVKENCAMYVEGQLSATLHGLNVDAIYKSLDAKYNHTDFENENHIKRSFTFCGEKLKEKGSTGTGIATYDMPTN